MKFFIDSCDIECIKFWIYSGIGSGVTTNPLILNKEGVENVDYHLREIVNIAKDHPVSIQITERNSYKIISQAEHFRNFGDNVVVKVPVVSSEGKTLLPIIHQLVKEGFKVNATACLMSTQAIMAAMAGAHYVSLFFGRISDQGSDPVDQITLVRNWLDRSKHYAKIIVGSIRSVYSITRSLECHPHICTVTPDILNKCADHAMSRQTVSDFEAAHDRLLSKVKV